MKAILVLEDLTEEEFINLRAKVELYDLKGERKVIYPLVRMITMPQKKEITEDMIWSTKYESQTSYYGGFNACIDEILGGVENGDNK